MSAARLCVVCNIGWIVVSTIGVLGSISHPLKDKLFLTRYVLALASSTASLVVIKLYPKRALGLLSIALFVPFILLQLAEIWVMYKCNDEVSTYWGIDCDSLLLYPDTSGRVLQVITDELAVFFLGVVNVWVLWSCHVRSGHLLYEMKKLRKTVSPQPFLSPVSDRAFNEFLSAEDGESRTHVKPVFSRVRGMSQPSIVQSLDVLRPEEARTVTELQSSFGQEPLARRFSVHDWLRLAWSRSLDAQKASEVLGNHKDWIAKWDLNSIPIETVRENFKAGFSVIAGRDFDGRPMLWQRMQFMTPGNIPLSVGIKSTWLALDAALADLESNRSGLCLVYDFTDVGMSNISLNLFDVRDGSLACGAGHPSHITRVLFINPPFVFKLGFNAARPLLPTSVTSLVTMISISENNRDSWYENLCPKTQLPEYLGGEQKGDYFAWLSSRLQGSHFMYHPSEIQPPSQ